MLNFAFHFFLAIFLFAEKHINLHIVLYYLHATTADLNSHYKCDVIYKLEVFTVWFF